MQESIKRRGWSFALLAAALLLPRENDAQTATVDLYPRIQDGHGVRAIYEDTQGNFWFGTWHGGVYRYDGKRLRLFTEEDGLSLNQTRRITEDDAGVIWFKTGRQISYYDGERIVTPHDRIYTSKDDWKLEPGDLWFAEDDAASSGNPREGQPGVYRYDGDRITFLRFPRPQGGDRIDWEYKVTGISRPSARRIWFCTYGSVIGYDGDAFTFMDDNTLGLDGSTGTLHVRSILEDSQGRLWIGNNGIGVLLREGDSTFNFTQKHKLGSTDNRNSGPLPGDVAEGEPSLDRVFAMGEDASGNIWFGTIKHGAWRYDGKSLRNFGAADGLTSPEITAVYSDRRGDLWLGGHGVFRFNGERFERIH